MVKTKSKRACPVCGTPFTGELCPVCVLHGALGNEKTVIPRIQSPVMVVDPSALVRNAINLYEAVWVRFLLSIGSTTANA